MRLAWRQVLRTKGSSILVTLLVALPVAALFGAAVFVESRTATPEEAVTLRLGHAQAQLVPISPLPEGHRQAIDEPTMSQYDGPMPPDDVAMMPKNPPPTTLSGLVPTGARVIPIDQGLVRIATRTGAANVAIVRGNTWDPVLTGAFRILSGTAPTGQGQAMASPKLLERIGAAVGDSVTLPDEKTTLTITGTLQSVEAQRYNEATLFTPLGTLPADAAADAGRSWFIADWQPSYRELVALNRDGYGVYARDLVLNPPPDAPTANTARTPTARWASFAVGAAFAVASGFLVALLAGAAFAVMTRRQQRSLAIAASVGAARGDLFRVVVLQGLALGLLGGLVGAVLGGAALAILQRVLDPGVQGLFWSSFGFRIPWDAAAAILLFAALVGTISAVAPARTAIRGDTLAALRGARRPAVLRKKLPVAGIVLLAGGAAISLGGGLIAAGVALPGTSATYVPLAEASRADTLRSVSLWMMILGPVLLQIGIILTGHAILRGLARVLSPLGLTPRLAARDAAANPTRTVPAFTAITASVFIATLALAALATSTAANARQYPWAGPLGSVTASFGTVDENATQVEKDARRLLDGTDPRTVFTISTPRSAPYDPQTGRPTTSDLREYRISLPGCDACSPGYGFRMLAVANPDAAQALYRGLLSDEQEQTLRDGGMLIALADNGHTMPATARIDGYPSGALGGGSTEPEKPSTTATVPATVLHAARSRFDALITPEAAQRLGIPIVASTLIATYDTPPDIATMDRLTADADAVSSRASSIFVSQENGPAPAAPWLTLITAAAGAIVLGAAAISLGLSRFERRPDDATLAAVGGSRVARRAVNAWQAMIITGLGAMLGVLSGLVPAWSMVFASPGMVQAGDLPLPWLAALAVVLPLLVTTCAWLVRPRRPELTHRTAIA